MSDPGGDAAVSAGAGVLLRLDDDGVAHLRMNRPATSNSLDVQSLSELREAVLGLHGEPRLRAVLLTGAGAHFCGGGDVKVFLDKGPDLPAYIRVATSLLSTVAAALIRLPAPVVAAVQGFAAGGGGMGLVCCSDFVVAGRSSKFLTGATRVGMVPDAGVTATLTRLIGFRRAMEIVMLNPVLTAQEALDYGLINRVVEDAALEAEALDLARRLAAGPPTALAAAKRLMWNGMAQGVETVMPEENAAQAQLAGTEDALEGLRAVIERRIPRFPGR